MAELTYTIPAGKLAEYVGDYIYVHKNTETIPDPAWVDPEDGSQAPQVAKYATDAAWVREHILRYIRSQIIRGKNSKARDALADTNADSVT